MNGSVIYVEDEPDDAFFMRRAFEASAPGCELKIFTNGRDVLEFLDAERPVRKVPAKPRLILLDVNLPGRSGIDILREIRAKTPDEKLPVVMYSSSNQTVDIDRAYAQGCSGYLVKPRTTEKLKMIVLALVGFWIRDNQYPLK